MPRRIPNALLSGVIIGVALTVITTAVGAFVLYIDIKTSYFWVPSKRDLGCLIFLFGPAVFWGCWSPGIWFYKDKVVLEYHQHRNRGTLKRDEITGFYLEDKNGVRLHFHGTTLEDTVIIFTLTQDRTRA